VPPFDRRQFDGISRRISFLAPFVLKISLRAGKETTTSHRDIL
jgi:hypothetical protein